MATKKKTDETKTPRMSIQEQAEKVLQIAEDSGVQSNFFFVTTFKRYQVQMAVLSQLEKEISNTGVLVTKEYVKGRQNLYTNPAVDQYNKTSTAANNTVSTLINIVRTLRPEDAQQKELSLDEVMNKLMKD